MKNLILSILLIVIVNSGCATVGVPITSNPDGKIKYAVSLLEDWGPLQRPLPAEPLIREAIEIYKKKGDKIGLAEAYRTYAFFFQSKAVENWEKHYRKYGFMDKTVTFDNRVQKALEYYEMAKDTYGKNSRYDAVTNIYLTVGHIYYLTLNDKATACNNYTKSLQSYLRFKKENPDEKIIFPAGFNNFEEYIEAVKKEAGCEQKR